MREGLYHCTTVSLITQKLQSALRDSFFSEIIKISAISGSMITLRGYLMY
jgi:hypothetical protein